MLATRYVLIILTAVLGVSACGSGSDSSGPSTAGSIDRKIITSRVNGTSYPLNIYLPPASAGSPASLPILYALDGESRFPELVNIVETSHSAFIVVGIGNEANRAHDYVPPNTCTPNGGGEAAFLDFIRTELIPFVESTIGGAPTKRALLGHSHGGSFVLYALLAQAPADHPFAVYLASDSSIWCMPATVAEWEQDYAAGYADLPVRLHVSYSGNVENPAFAQALQNRHYPNLTVEAHDYVGGHIGMIPAAFTAALAFAFPKIN